MMCLADLIGFFFGILESISTNLIWKKNYRNQLPWWDSQRCLANHCVVVEPMIVRTKIYFFQRPGPCLPAASRRDQPAGTRTSVGASRLVAQGANPQFLLSNSSFCESPSAWGIPLLYSGTPSTEQFLQLSSSTKHPLSSSAHPFLSQCFQVSLNTT